MPKDIFGGFGGFMKGLSGFMPQDDPDVQLMNAQNEVNELKNQEEELYAEIGRKAVKLYGLDIFGDTANKLKLVQSNLSSAREKLDKSKSEKEAKEKAERAAVDACTCPSCGHENLQGTKFCQECGTKLEAAKTFCTSCGSKLAPGTRFCGECGASQ